MALIAGMRPQVIIREYVSAIRQAIRNRAVRIFLVIRILEPFTTIMWTTYAVIYLTDRRGLGLSEASIAILPFVSALVTMALILLTAKRMQAAWTFSNLVTGQVMWLAAAACFILSPAHTLWFAVVWAALNAAGTALFRPAGQSYWANIVGNRERAQVFSASSALIALFTVPAGPLAGLLYTLNPQAPFALGIGLQLLVLGLIVSLRSSSQPSQQLIG